MNVQPKKLIVIGDSGVYGWGDNDYGGWCESLRKKWMSEKNSPVIYSLGVRGDVGSSIISIFEFFERAPAISIIC